MESIFSDMMTRARASIPSIKIEFSVIEDYVIVVTCRPHMFTSFNKGATYGDWDEWYPINV